MAKYLVQASYTVQGTQGLLRDGGTKRRQAIDQMVAGVGGRLESIYFAFGDADAYLIVEAPDNVSVAAVSLVVNASGAASVKTISLLTPEEIDQATKKSVAYQPPGR